MGALGSIEWEPPTARGCKTGACGRRRGARFLGNGSVPNYPRGEFPYIVGAMLFDDADKDPLYTASAGIFLVAQLLRPILENFRTRGAE